MAGLDLASGLDAVHFGHRDVHQDHVRAKGGSQLDGFGTVSGLTDHLEASFGHRSPEAFAKHAMVVGQHEPNVRSPTDNGAVGRVLCGEALRHHPCARMHLSVVPSPGVEVNSNEAPMLDALSRIPRIP